ncbi:uncharacterized protein BJX67DRAFT_218534 [Aspergillus lucknowensis]|uniref:Protein kinase domain-containing protein n=1 Tax=Aspergillus lucknowensis TaxID=176173 RepID=A0ABR4M3J4_9EURO
MTDPVSVAGITVAVVDALIKYGERTAELISDARAFHDVSTKLHRLVVDENLQTKLLKGLLFSECWVYGGRTLFEQFEPDVQGQIDLLFAEIQSILREAVDLLERRYSVSSSRTSPSIPVILRWSFRDKRRVEAILLSFKDRNSRLKRKIELWCLTSQLGISSDHLRHLQSDETSKRLGFDKDAALRLAQHGAEASELDSLELSSSWEPYLQNVTPVEHQGLFTVLLKDSHAYIQENHRYNITMPAHGTSPASSSLDARTKGRIESLARLLHQPKEQIFRILPCVGWRKIPDQDAVAFIFELQNPLGAPVSLQRILHESKFVPSLGDRFRLALELSQCMAQIHMVQWLHESFRSDNILLLPHHNTTDDLEQRLDINYAEPWVLGFEFSRPEPYFSAGHSDFEPSRDVYQHPDRQGQPTSTFNKFHDIYSLGVVLLEIGLWEPAIKLEKNLFAYATSGAAVRAQLIKHAQRRLEPRVGKRYKDVVLKCLTGDFGAEDDTRENMKLQQAFRHQVLDVIEQAANAV